MGKEEVKLSLDELHITLHFIFNVFNKCVVTGTHYGLEKKDLLDIFEEVWNVADKDEFDICKKRSNEEMQNENVPIKFLTGESEKRLNKEVCLKTLIEITSKREASRYGDVYLFTCPFSDSCIYDFVVKGNKYYCFHCDAQGDAISYMMCTNKMTWNEAVDFLSKMFNVKLEWIDGKPDILDVIKKTKD